MASGTTQITEKTPPFEASTKAPGYIPILDGWRAVAILLVIQFHGLLHSDTSRSDFFKASGVVSEKVGTLGVLIFFCISGYLITQKLLAESYRRGRLSIASFYVKRIFRILPPLVTYLIVICILAAFHVIKLKAEDWAAPAFLSNYIHGGSWYTSQFWSLAVEEHFYLFWPICAILAGWRRSLFIGLLVIALVAVWRPWALSHLSHTVQPAGLLQHTDMRIDYIMMGCVVAIGLAYDPRTKSVLKSLGSPFGLLAMLIVLILTTLHPPFEVRSLQALLLTLMVCGSVNSSSVIMSRLMENPAMLFIGRISYSLYIWQQLILCSFATSKLPFINSPLALLIKIPFAIVVASASYYFIEKPFIARGRKLLVE